MNELKRVKRHDTLLEQLPNELIVEIFGYLNGVDAVYAFSQLNNRFQCLLKNYVNTFAFKSISKAKFDFVTQHHDIHRWRSLRLSGDDETPGQIKLFCQLFSPAEYISQLQSLSVVNMEKSYGKELFSHFRSFDNLESLTIETICGHDIRPIELSSLKRLVVNSCGHTKWMMRLCCLESLECVIVRDCGDTCVLLPITLKQLKLFYSEEEVGDNVRKSLRPLLKLTKLSLYNNGSCSPWPDGGKWEELIKSSLPLLATFQFCFPFVSRGTIHNNMNVVVSSFSTPFYLIEKRWFVQCDLNRYFYDMGAVYSLPFAFAMMPITTRSFRTSISTLVANDITGTKINLYAKVKTLVLNQNCESPNQDLATSNIIHLILKNSLNTNWIHLLTNLRRLEIREGVHFSPTYFANFLTNSLRLQSLTIPISELEKLTDRFMNNIVCTQLSQTSDR